MNLGGISVLIAVAVVAIAAGPVGIATALAGCVWLWRRS